VRKWLATVLALVFIGASTQCLAECAGQLSKVPPCHQHSQKKCSTESQLTASSPDSPMLTAIMTDASEWSLPSAMIQQYFGDSTIEPIAAEETPPIFSVLRI
jgi:hypothetical protein